MQIRLTLPSADVDAETLGAAADVNAIYAQRQIERGIAPTAEEAIDAGLVVWKPEDNRPGRESFDPPSVVLARGAGDCDDLAPWHAASLRATGEDPGAQPIAYQSGPTRWHVVVQRSDGSIDDPSRWAGMGRVEGNRPAVARPLRNAAEHAVVGMRRARDGSWVARLDAPIDGVCGVAIEQPASDQLSALARVCGSLGVLALWGTPEDVLEKLAACRAALRGVEGDYSVYGDFVQGVAGAVAKLSVDPHSAADIAATIIDPLGLRNIAAPLAQQFVQSYAQGLAQRGAAPAAAPPATTQPTTSGVGRMHRYGVSGESSRGSSRGSQDGRGSARGSARGISRGSSRGGGRSRQQPDQSYDDGSQYGYGGGYYFDPSSGMWWDPISGLPIDPNTGMPYGAFGGGYGYGGAQGYGYGGAPQSTYGYPAQYAYPAQYGYPSYGYGGGYGAYPGYGY